MDRCWPTMNSRHGVITSLKSMAILQKLIFKEIFLFSYASISYNHYPGMTIIICADIHKKDQCKVHKGNHTLSVSFTPKIFYLLYCIDDLKTSLIFPEICQAEIKTQGPLHRKGLFLWIID